MAHACVSRWPASVSVLHVHCCQSVCSVSHRHSAAIPWWAVRCVTVPDPASQLRTSAATQTAASAGKTPYTEPHVYYIKLKITNIPLITFPKTFHYRQLWFFVVVLCHFANLKACFLTRLNKIFLFAHKIPQYCTTFQCFHKKNLLIYSVKAEKPETSQQTLMPEPK